MFGFKVCSFFVPFYMFLMVKNGKVLIYDGG